MNSTEVSSTVSQNEVAGQTQGVTRAPSLLFNGDFISGVPSTGAFITNLEAALSELAE